MDPLTRDWSPAVDDFVLSVSPVPGDRSEAGAISIALRNIGDAAVTLDLPAWLFFYHIEISGASLTPYGKALLAEERNTERQTVLLEPASSTETHIPISALFAMHAPGPHQITVSCQLPAAREHLRATTVIM
ncbi:MAG: hypothetical protein M3N54_02045 [Acidobacteriota bacterium]|nr:hypothetical protein [Acidobacteriota bacterium]